MSSSAEPAPVLIAALSGRALAAAAARAGERVIVFDLFADCDTARYAEACSRLPRGPVGFERRAFLAAVERVAGAVRGFVYGAGFEHDPDLLGEIARRVPLIGNLPGAVAAVKDPSGFAALLARLSLPHPATSRKAPSGGGWLRKMIGGSGGSHIASAVSAAATPETYFQRRVPGCAISASFLADGTAARVLGFTEQWTSGDAAAPFRYGGCAGPVPLSPRLAEAIETACDAVAAGTGLVGLNSLDLLVEQDRFHVLEVNPRPGATLDIFDGLGALSLWRLHVDAVAGRLPPAPRAEPAMARAAAIVYAPRAVVIPGAMAWP
ncbi:MAG TPA: ATP-grasp domain-containing protein, partial [Stellaceae bacterium]